MNNLRKLALELVTAGTLILCGIAGAQQQPQPLKVTKLKDNVYWVQGGVGSNDGVIVGNTGVVARGYQDDRGFGKGSDR